MKLDPELFKVVAKRGMQVLTSLILMMIVFFISAGRVDLVRVWAYFGIYLLAIFFNLVVLFKYNPEVIKARSVIVKGKMKWWDKLFAVLYFIFMLAVPAVCGYDIRVHSTDLKLEYYIMGIVIFIVGWGFTTWALVVNKFFEGGVRIQKERDHRVISTGPYSLIRHPGYAGMIVFYLSMPLGLGSFYGLIPAFLIAANFCFRTYFEDKMLRGELKGYVEYSKKVRYRLIPGIW